MKIGMISFAHMHAHSYAASLKKHPSAELVAIWDNEQQRGTEAAEQYDCQYEANLDTFLNLDLDAVIICSENARHREHVEAAARAKKHILCEKPIATTVEDAQAMIQVCADEGVHLHIAYPVRYAAPSVRLKEMIQDGVLGDIVAINATNHGQMPGGWFTDAQLSGGGAAVDHIVHVMDLVRWMLNDEAERVYAEMNTRYYSLDVEDCGIAMIEMQSGLQLSVDFSWSRPKTFPTWGDLTLHLIGTKGSISFDVLKQSSVFYDDDNQNVQYIHWLEDMDQELVNHFIHQVQTGEQPAVSGEDGLRTLEVVQAAYASSRAGKFVNVK